MQGWYACFFIGDCETFVQLAAQARGAQARRVRTLRFSEVFDNAFDVTRSVCKCWRLQEYDLRQSEEIWWNDINSMNAHIFPNANNATWISMAMCWVSGCVKLCKLQVDLLPWPRHGLWSAHVACPHGSHSRPAESGRCFFFFGFCRSSLAHQSINGLWWLLSMLDDMELDVDRGFLDYRLRWFRMFTHVVQSGCLQTGALVSGTSGLRWELRLFKAKLFRNDQRGLYR